MPSDQPIGVRIGARLREARLHAGLTVREVGDRISLKHAIIVKYENGSVVPSIERLRVLARLYGLTTAALLAEHDRAMPLFTLLDRASADEIEHLVQVLQEVLQEG